MRRVFGLLTAVVALAVLALMYAVGPDRLSRGLVPRHYAPAPARAETAVAPETARAIRQAVAAITPERVRAQIAHFASMPAGRSAKSRVTGYPGCDEAAAYIRNVFHNELRLQDVVAEPFEIAVPVDQGASLTWTVPGQGAQTVPLQGLWPNHVQPPALPEEGVEGVLIDGLDGRLADLARRTPEDPDLADAVVLLRFGSGQRYLEAAALGARAILFYSDPAESDHAGVTRAQAALKVLDVPADIPRLWVAPADVPRVRALAQSRRVRVRVRSAMRWERRTAHNIMGILPGRDEPLPGSTPRWRDVVILLQAYYDSTSVVPAQAPGAENAAGLVALLETARALRAMGPHGSVVFLATAGHFQALAGVTEFVSRHSRAATYFRDRIPPSRRVRFDLMIGLDLSSHGRQVAVMSEGAALQSRPWAEDEFRRRALAPYAERLVRYSRELAEPVLAPTDAWPGQDGALVDAVAPKKRPWWSFLGTPLAFDAQVATQAGQYALTLFTAHDGRALVDTPLDTVDRMDLAGLTRQIRTVAAVVLRANTDPQFVPDTKLALRDLVSAQHGAVMEFDRRVNFFAPKAPVGGALVTCLPATWRHQDQPNYAGVRMRAIRMTAERDPAGGDAQRGFQVQAVTTDSRLLEVTAWDRFAGPGPAQVVVSTRHGVFRYPMVYQEAARRWRALVPVDRSPAGLGSAAAVGLGGLLAAAGLWLAGRRVSSARRWWRAGLRGAALMSLLAGLFWAGSILVFRSGVPVGPPDPEEIVFGPVIREIAIAGRPVNAAPVRVEHGRFRGHFTFPMRWGELFTAYKLDAAGRLILAPDRGPEGAETYPIHSSARGREPHMLEVLFPCRSLTLFETIDAQYLNTLDYLSVLGQDNARPPWYGFDLVERQGTFQGPTTDVAVVYARPTERVKVLMSTGLVGVKYLLAGAWGTSAGGPEGGGGPRDSPGTEILGQGYPMTLGRVTRPALAVAGDLWTIDEARLETLRRHGIRNDRLEELHQEAGRRLEEARRAMDAGRYDQAVAAAREAWGLESRAYPEVRATANDTVRGVVFYLMLLVPFSFFMERLIFGFPKIRAQILGFAGLFAAAFGLLHVVHPAFWLGSSPYIILLAFVIFALGAVVLVVVMRKFTAQMRAMRAQGAGRREVDIDRVSATLAALLLGVSNLRKRPVRTALTAGTLVLLTFAALSFTSVKTYLDLWRVPRSAEAPYRGVMVRDRGWRGLQSSVLPHVQSAFQDVAVVVPRARLLGWAPDRKASLMVTREATGRFCFAEAALGLHAAEDRLTAPQRAIRPGGRWFRPEDRHVCLLSSQQATLLGLTAADVGSAKVELLGRELTVIGLFDERQMAVLRDLDAEPITPISPEQLSAQAATVQSPEIESLPSLRPFQHLEAGHVIVLPFDTVMDLGGVLASVGVGCFQHDDPMPAVRRFLRRLGLAVFVAEPDGQVAFYTALGRTALTHASALLVPMLLVGLIVFNTMMGSVYERTREIAIFSSVGLAPLHVGAVFLAEAAVFATVGAVLGYLVGQTLAAGLSRLGLAGGLFMNYSALSAVTSTLVVMGTVFVSAIYPARQAAALSVPDVSRRFELPEPVGDQWSFEFPFTLGRSDVCGLYAYLAQTFESFSEGSMGGFIAESVHLAGRADRYGITMTTWLAPYDLGVSQHVVLEATPTRQPDIYAIHVRLERLSGDVATWRRLNRRFLTLLRKQFLVWRTIGPTDKARYDREGRQRLLAQPAPEEDQGVDP